MSTNKKFLSFIIITITTCILSIFPTLAVEEFDHRLYSAERLTLDMSVKSGMEVRQLGADPYIEYVKATHYYYPKYDAFQDSMITEVTPQAKKNMDSYAFKWVEPSLGKYDIKIDAEVDTVRSIGLIKDSADFPLQNLHYSYDKYKKQGKIIVIDEEIKQIANQLAQGRDNLYDVEFALAKWVKENIEYDLDTTTSGAALSSSWVMKNRRGVCDELTSLFIAMNRALGIPARFVSGVAYTNLDIFPDHWGAHGWAEVYFPDVGWVPYDITYGQFGYIDPTHVKLITSEFVSSPSIRYESKAFNAEVNILPTTFDIEILEKGKIAPPQITLRLIPVKKSVGMGSYNLLQATLTNKEYFYISTDVRLQNTSNLQIIDQQSKMVYLEPEGTATLYWIIKVDNNLESDYIYTFPIAIENELGLRAESEFVVKEIDDEYDMNYFKKIIMSNGDDFEKDFLIKTSPFSITCSSNKDELYPAELAAVKCEIIDTRNTSEIFSVCLDDVCKNTNKIIQFNVTLEELGITTKEIIAKQGEYSVSDYVTLKLIEPEKIELKNITFPKEVEYDDLFEIRFVLNNVRNSVPKNITASINHDFFKQVWELSELEHQQGYVLKMQAQDLKPKNNVFNINVKYMTKDGNFKLEKYEFTINIKNMSFGQMFNLWMNYISSRLKEQMTLQIEEIEEPKE